jgi:hypothetical protein
MDTDKAKERLKKREQARFFKNILLFNNHCFSQLWVYLVW